MGMLKPAELQGYGIKIPENLQRLAVFSLKEFIVIDDEKLRFVPLRKIPPNQYCLFEEYSDFKSKTPFVSKYDIESFFLKTKKIMEQVLTVLQKKIKNL